MQVRRCVTGRIIGEIPESSGQGIHLAGAHLQWASLEGMRFAGADLRHGDLRHARLNQADLRRGNLSLAQLAGADLAHSDLSNALLLGADLSAANLEGAILHGADLTGATHDPATRWPDGFSPQEHGATRVLNGGILELDRWLTEVRRDLAEFSRRATLLILAGFAASIAILGSALWRVLAMK